MKQLLPIACLLLLAACSDAGMRRPGRSSARWCRNAAPFRPCTRAYPRRSRRRSRPALRRRPAGDESGTITLAAPEAGDAAPDPGFCARGEQVVFGCHVGPDRSVALCGSDGFPEGGMLQYREGASGQPPALVWPEDGQPASEAYRSGTLMYSGGGGAFLRFDREDRTYTVYTGIGRGWDKAGVVVQAGGDTVEELACDGAVASLIGPELFTRAGIAKDGQGFEIP